MLSYFCLVVKDYFKQFFPFLLFPSILWTILGELWFASFLLGSFLYCSRRKPLEDKWHRFLTRHVLSVEPKLTVSKYWRKKVEALEQDWNKELSPTLVPVSVVALHWFIEYCDDLLPWNALCVWACIVVKTRDDCWVWVFQLCVIATSGMWNGLSVMLSLLIVDVH